MKNYLTFALLFISISIFSQEKVFRVGFVTGADIRTGSVVFDNDYDYSYETGFHGGAIFNISFSELIGLQPEVLFETQDGFDAGYISVPIMFEVKPIKGLSFQLGPKLGVLVYGDSYYDGYFDYELYESFNAGIAAGVQYVAPFGLLANIRPVYSISDSNLLISLSIGMMF